jgi:hypothetical protein
VICTTSCCAHTDRGNMFGIVVSAIGAYVIPSTTDVASLFWANLGTFLGAACFLVAALLSRRLTQSSLAESPS